MQISKTAIISPSGKFYGSEQTLFSFLAETKQVYKVYVNSFDGQLVDRLKKSGDHYIITFSNVKKLMVTLFFKLLRGKYNCIYVNEGGYIRYIKILARLFSKVKFVIHIRLTEDAYASRLGSIPSNITLVSVSKFIAEMLKKEIGKETTVISSPQRGQLSGDMAPMHMNGTLPVKAAVVGRVTDSKGLTYIEQFCDYMENRGSNDFELHFFGDVEKDKNTVARFVDKTERYQFLKVYFHGYRGDKNDIYKSVDVVMHFNPGEPLGVIFFEALNFGRPIVGFHSGGIGEIADNLGLAEYMTDNTSANWCTDMYNRLQAAKKNTAAFNAAREKMTTLYSVKTYCEKVERIILQ